MRWLTLAFAAALVMPAAAKSWAVDAATSKLGFEASMNGEPIAGTFSQWRAEIEFDPAALGSAKAKVTIDLASVSTGNSTRDKALPSKAWFDTTGSTFTASPGVAVNTAVFETTAFRQTGANAYEADGTLTMRGQSQALTLPFTLEVNGGAAHMTARLPIDRTRWGIGQGDYAGDTPVATKVDVVIDLNAVAP